MTSTSNSDFSMPMVDGRQILPSELLWWFLSALVLAPGGADGLVDIEDAGGALQAVYVDGALLRPELAGHRLFLLGFGMNVDTNGNLQGFVQGFGIEDGNGGFQETQLFFSHAVPDMLQTVDPGRLRPDPALDPTFFQIFVASSAHLYSFYGTDAPQTAAVMPGVNSMFMGGGDDLVFLGAEGSGTLRGEAGLDLLSGQQISVGLTINLDLGLVQTDGGGVFNLSGFERAEGGAGDDLLTAAWRTRSLDGGGGSDTLQGSGAPDVLRGGGGSDTLRGGGGNDRQEGGPGADWLEGGGRHDTLAGHGGNDRLAGGGGDDLAFGGTGNDRLFGGAGNDRSFGETGDDSLVGGAGDDQLWGDSGIGAGNDTLDGGTGNDELSAGGGNDRLYGGDGDDWIFGGAGNDTILGGDGADRFVFASITSGDRDRIVDFVPGEDVIAAGLGEVTGFSTAADGSDAIITLELRDGTTATIRVVGVDPSAVTIDLL